MDEVGAGKPVWCPPQQSKKWTRTNVGATEDAGMIGFNVAIRGREERGTKHGEDGDGDGGDGNQRPLAQDWAKRFTGINSSALMGRSYYDSHFRVEETEEECRDEVICANRTRMIL